MLRQTLVMAAIGIGAGVIVVVQAARFLEELLFNLSERDPMTLAMVALLLFCTAMIAGWLPARRAASLDPVTAIKTE